MFVFTEEISKSTKIKCLLEAEFEGVFGEKDVQELQENINTPFMAEIASLSFQRKFILYADTPASGTWTFNADGPVPPVELLFNNGTYWLVDPN